MSWSFSARPHPMLPPAAEYELPDFELRDESQEQVGFEWHGGSSGFCTRSGIGQERMLVAGHEISDMDDTRDVSLSEAAALLPSFLLPPETDLSALPGASPAADAWHDDNTLVGGATWRHSDGPAAMPSSASSHLRPLSVAPSSCRRSGSDYQMCALLGGADGLAYGSGGLSQAYTSDDVRVVSDAMGWRYPQAWQASKQDVHPGPDDAYMKWGHTSASGAAEGLGMWGGSLGDTSRLWGCMGTGLGGSTDDGCELEVIAGARSLKQLLSMPYSDQRVSLAVHRVGETLLIDQPPAAGQSWSGAGAGAHDRQESGFGSAVAGGEARRNAGTSSVDEGQEAGVTPKPPAGPARTIPARDRGTDKEEDSGEGGREEDGSRRRRKRSGKKNAKNNNTLDLERLLYTQLIAAGARGSVGGASGGLHLPCRKAAATTAAEKSKADTSTVGSAGDEAESVLSCAGESMAGIKTLDKWADAQWAHAHDSSDEEDVESCGRTSDGMGGEYAGWPPRMCRFKLGSMRMLLGSDVMVLDHPSSGQPCVSLYVRDPEIMSRSLLLDVWLDNVIASVPHVLMCWHKNAVIQGYMLKRTQDLPALSHFEFSPERIERCGKQVLKWLRSNCTSEASTYWLLKERGDERLQLYNLSALHQFTSDLAKSTSETEAHAQGDKGDDAQGVDAGGGGARAEQAHVPDKFAFPVAMLCIRAAARLSMQVTPEARARRRELLLHGVSLLDPHKHASLLANVHECIAETYVAIPLDHDLPQGTADRARVDRGLGCVESYPSLHADTFVLPSSDKRRDAEQAVKHLSHALAGLQRALPCSSSAGVPGLLAVLARLRRKAIECFAFLSQVHTSKGQWDEALEMLANAFQCAQPMQCGAASNTAQRVPLRAAEALLLARLRCLLGDAVLSAAERQPTAPPTPTATPIPTPHPTPPPTPPPTPKGAARAPNAMGVAEMAHNLPGAPVHSWTNSAAPLNPSQLLPESFRLKPALGHGSVAADSEDGAGAAEAPMSSGRASCAAATSVETQLLSSAPLSPPPDPAALGALPSGSEEVDLEAKDGGGAGESESGKGDCASGKVSGGGDTQAVLPARSEHMPAFPIYPGHSVLDMTRVQALTQCVSHYERARSYLPHHQSYIDFVNASRRLGHVHNELGKSAGKDADIAKAERHWRAAQAVFASIGDAENHAVLNINLAQLLRGRSARLQREYGVLTVAARTHIAEAVAMYETAFGALKKKHANPAVWLMVQSELAATFEDFAVMLEADGAREGWSSGGAREDAQLVVDLRNRAIELLRDMRAPGWRLAQAHLSLGTFYTATLHVGSGVVTRTRYDAAEGQLRKCLLLAGGAVGLKQDTRSVSPAKRPAKDRQAWPDDHFPDRPAGGQAAATGAVLDVNSEIAVLGATAQLSLLLRVSGGPLKGAQALRSSLEALLSILRLPLRREAASEGNVRLELSSAHLTAWRSVAESVKGLTKELATVSAGMSLGGPEVPRDTLKDLYRQALKVNPDQDAASVACLLEILQSLAKLFAARG